MSAKRKLSTLGLDRRVRPRKEDEWEPEADDARDASSGEEDEDDSGSEHGDSDDDDEGSEGDASDEEGSNDEAEDDDPKKALASISFGALARAQASLPPSEKQLKKKKASSGGNEPGSDAEKDDKHTKSKQSAAAAAATAKAKAKRSSKHAPQEVSSKRPVSRKREIVAEERRAPARDPRFDPLSTGGAARFDDTKARRAYAFLDEYRDKEMAELKAQAKKTKDPVRKEELKRQVMSMESRRKAQKKKDEEQAILAEHRRREKELVAQGKQPFYLKRSEQKKQLLTNRFENMSKGQADKAMARKMKKVAGKEKKELDSWQRVTDRRGHH